MNSQRVKAILLYSAIVACLVAGLPETAAGQGAGVGYNPFPTAPDPWEVARAMGLGGVREENPRWALPLEWGGMPETRAAWMARYGMGPEQPFPMGSENELTLWPRVLRLLWQYEWSRGQGAGLDGEPLPREVKDAARIGDKGLIVRAFTLDRQPGYVADKPIRLEGIWAMALQNMAERPAPGLFSVPGRKQGGKPEPEYYAALRSSYGATLFYFMPGDVAAPDPPKPSDPKPTDPPPVTPPVCPVCPVCLPCQPTACPAPPPPTLPPALVDQLAGIEAWNRINDQGKAALSDLRKWISWAGVKAPEAILATIDAAGGWAVVPPLGGRRVRLRQLADWLSAQHGAAKATPPLPTSSDL